MTYTQQVISKSKTESKKLQSNIVALWETIEKLTTISAQERRGK